MDSQAAKAASMLTNTLRSRRGDRSTLEPKSGAKTHRTPKALRAKSMEGSSIRPTTAGLWKCDLPALSEVEWASSRRLPKSNYACSRIQEKQAKSETADRQA